MKVQWQVYSTALKKPVYETVTEGSYQADDSVPGGTTELMRNAFASATHAVESNDIQIKQVNGS